MNRKLIDINLTNNELINNLYEHFNEKAAKLLFKYFNIIIDYQKLNNITCQCVANTTTFYLYLSHINNMLKLNKNIKIIPVIAIQDKKENLIKKCYIHVVIKLEDIIIDPSYETYLNVKYYENINNVPKMTHLNISDKDLFNNFMELYEITNNINNGILILPDHTYFDNLSNYIADNNYKYDELINY